MPDEIKNLDADFANQDGGVEDIFEDVERKNFISDENKNSDNSSSNRKKFNKNFVRVVFIIIIIAIVGAGVYYYALPKIKNLMEQAKIKKLNQTGQPQANSEDKTAPIIIIKPIEMAPDADGDGLTDEEEITLGTDKNKSDTDNDGLSDREEVKVYLTNPLKLDTDGDGIKDSQEIKNNTDPNNSNPNAKLLDLQKEIDKLK
ncbi:MAG: hypothetical protein PHE59_02895 [Patescibacteria group bacterium]|nr:hypothetical protein [Patescibacteria group bacterium]MDD5164416.1 hypothetical protein [Patescibacteria group bacterium]MDD5534607.1 hypothetical protein [Patescibacteria group bacterium]